MGNTGEHMKYLVGTLSVTGMSQILREKYVISWCMTLFENCVKYLPSNLSTGLSSVFKIASIDISLSLSLSLFLSYLHSLLFSFLSHISSSLRLLKTPRRGATELRETAVSFHTMWLSLQAIDNCSDTASSSPHHKH